MAADYERFGRDFWGRYLAQGFGSLSKADTEALLLHQLEQAGVIDWWRTDQAVADELRVTPTKVKGLRKLASARFLTHADRRQRLLHWLTLQITEENLLKIARFATTNKSSEGLLPLLVNHAGVRESLRAELQELNLIPVTEKNPDVLWVAAGDLSQLCAALRGGAGWQQRVGEALAAHAPKGAPPKDLPSLLTADVQKLDAAALRSAVNGFAGKLLGGGAEESVKALWPLLAALLLA